MRQGILLEGDPEGELAALVDELDVCGKVAQAWTWGRLFGGGAIVLGFADGAQDEPLDEERIGPGSLRFLLVVDKRDIQPWTWNTDPTEAGFGEPETYRVVVQSGRAGTFDQPIVHASRIIRFGGQLTTRRRKDARNGWDDSVLQRAHDIIRDAGMNWQSAAHALHDLSQAVYGVKDLAKMIATGQREKLQTLMEDVDIRRSSMRAIMVDAEHERFEQVGKQNLGAVPALLQQTWLRVAATADGMPLTRLMGMSPAGLNATGESDTRTWYDKVQAQRQRHAVPALTRIVRLVAKSAAPKGVDPDEVFVSFPSLYQLDPAEEAELRNKQANTDSIYIQAGVLRPQEVAIARFGRGQWSAETEIDMDVREALRKAEEEAMKAEAERAAEEAKNPTPTPPQLAPFTGQEQTPADDERAPEPGDHEGDEEEEP
jgi:uncharacterized protein